MAVEGAIFFAPCACNPCFGGGQSDARKFYGYYVGPGTIALTGLKITPVNARIIENPAGSGELYAVFSASISAPATSRLMTGFIDSDNRAHFSETAGPVIRPLVEYQMHIGPTLKPIEFGDGLPFILPGPRHGVADTDGEGSVTWYAGPGALFDQTYPDKTFVYIFIGGDPLPPIP